MRDELSSIRILNTETHSEMDIPCTKILIAAGAWSPQVYSTLFPHAKKKLPISSLAGHSLVVRSPGWRKEHEERGCHAIFTTDDQGYSPEIFSRIGEEIYIAGLNSSALPLPDLATASEIDENAVDKLVLTSKRLLGIDDLEVLRKGLCFRPVTNRGTPFLTRISDDMLGDAGTRGEGEGGVWLAAGHGPWGIALSLGSGKVMAEMIQGKPTSVDVGELGL
jgi:glycine/D-amino acid oxidase-like deaminating enzyme